MPSFHPGPLFGSTRYQVTGGAGRDLFCHHAAEMRLPALAAAAQSGDGMTVELKSIDYERFVPGQGETFAQYVDRRRQELRREAELLASYHDITAHVPQIIDVVEGRNTWDAAVGACGKADGEPCLVLEQLQGEPLIPLVEPLSQFEALDIAERLLMVLRVFHGKDLKSGAQRYFFTLFPDDVVVDRGSRDCWLRNLWKLRTLQELRAGRIYCDPNRQAFVSPALAGYLQPPPSRPVSFTPSPGHKVADADLYSVGAILYHMLCGGPDLSTQPPGFLTAAEIERLREDRGLSPQVADFLRGLVEHSHHSAQKALEELARIRGHKPPEFLFIEPRTPPSQQPAVPHLPDGTVLGQRYRVRHFLAAGGLGCVYLGEDQRTGATVVLKTLLYEKDKTATSNRKTYCLERRAEHFEEARLAVRLHHRTGAVPQLLDVVLAEPADPDVAGDPDLAGAADPVLVLEYIPGNSLFRNYENTAYTEVELLRLLRNVCGIAGHFHRPDAQQDYFLYVDWKPDNIMRHPESGNITIVDLGAAVPVVNGQWQGKSFSSTPPYSAPEERLPGQSDTNRNLRPTYDLHGIAAVVWQLAVRPKFADLRAWAEAVAAGTAKFPVLDASRVSTADYPRLRPILAKALEVDPARRFQTAEEMAAAALEAMGRTSALPPEKPLRFVAEPQSNSQVKLVCRLPADPFCERIIICRDSKAVSSHAGGVVVEADVRGRNPGETVSWDDNTLDAQWTEAHYAAFSIGYNGQASAAMPCHVHLLVDPLVQPVVRGEEQLVLHWEVPELVRRNNGVVVVERITDTRLEIYEGLGTELTDAQLDPTHRYRYRIYCRMPYGSSQGVNVEASPLPRLARLAEIAAEGGDRRVAVRFRLPPAAVDQIAFVRTQKPLDATERAELLAHSTRGVQPPAGLIRFSLAVTLDNTFRAVGVASDPAVTCQQLPDGSLQIAWADTSARPGQHYCYTPLLTYRDGNRQWLEAATEADAYAEAEKFEAEPLPGGVRLRWSLRDPADEVRLQREDAGGTPRVLGRVPPTQAVWLDRGLPARQPATYRLQLRTGRVWSVGRLATCAPVEPLQILPPLWLAPGERALHVRYPAGGADGSAPRLGFVDGDGPPPVPRLDDDRGDWRQQTFDFPAGRAANMQLTDAAGGVLGSASAAAFSEVRNLRVRLRGNGMDVAWDAPEGCDKVLVTLCGTVCRCLVAASQRRLRIAPLPPGAHRVLVQTLTCLGDLSKGVLGVPDATTPPRTHQERAVT